MPFDHNNPKVGDRVVYNGQWTVVAYVHQNRDSFGKRCRLSNGFDNVVFGLDPRFDAERTATRDWLEHVVDQVAEALGLDTGACSLDLYDDAIVALEEALNE